VKSTRGKTSLPRTAVLGAVSRRTKKNLGGPNGSNSDGYMFLDPVGGVRKANTWEQPGGGWETVLAMRVHRSRDIYQDVGGKARLLAFLVGDRPIERNRRRRDGQIRGKRRMRKARGYTVNSTRSSIQEGEKNRYRVHMGERRLGGEEGTDT